MKSAIDRGRPLSADDAPQLVQWVLSERRTSRPIMPTMARLVPGGIAQDSARHRTAPGATIANARSKRPATRPDAIAGNNGILRIPRRSRHVAKRSSCTPVDERCGAAAARKHARHPAATQLLEGRRAPAARTNRACSRNLRQPLHLPSRMRGWTKRIACSLSARTAPADRCTRAAPPAIVTGGGPGILEAGNRGAYERGAPSAGFNIELPREQASNPYIPPDLCFRLHYFAIRMLQLLARAKSPSFSPAATARSTSCSRC